MCLIETQARVLDSCLHHRPKGRGEVSKKERGPRRNAGPGSSRTRAPRPAGSHTPVRRAARAERARSEGREWFDRLRRPGCLPHQLPDCHPARPQGAGTTRAPSPDSSTPRNRRPHRDGVTPNPAIRGTPFLGPCSPSGELHSRPRPARLVPLRSGVNGNTGRK